jgi:PmbA protein
MKDHSKLIDDILSLCRDKTDECDVVVSTGSSIPVEYEANRLKNIHSKQFQSVSLRVIKDGKLGIASTDILDDPKSLVDNAIESASYGSKVSYTLPDSASYPSIELYDKDVEAVTIDQMVECGNKLIETITKLDPNIVCEGGVSKDTGTCEFANSKGLSYSFCETSFDIALAGTIINGSDMLFLGDGKSSCKVDWNIRDIIETITEQYERTRRQAQVKSGLLPVIFSPNGFCDAFIPSICEGINGKLVLEGASPLTGKLGDKVFDEKFTLTDDATIPYRPGSRPMDGEGIPSKLLPLFENGKVANFIYDLKTAALAKTKSTGHGSRGGSLPSPTNMIVKPGTMMQSEMIKTIKEGILVEELMGAEQGNVLGGDFSGNVLLGYKIENGEIVGRVKDTVVSGNIYELLKDISAIGNDSKWIGGVYTPSICFPAVSCASH